MLTKLMKYEFKATSRLLVPLYLLLFFISIINRFTFKLYDYEGIVGIINKFLIFTYVTTIFIVLVVTVFYMIIRFYKNLLTDEGYLMFTLPAKTHQLITSKLLSTILWTIISIIAVLISFFIVFATPDSLPAAINGLKEAIATFNREFGGNWVLPFTEIVIMCLLSVVANILLIYVSVAVGQLFSKHKLIGSFAAYMIIYMVLQFIMLIIFIPFGVFMSKNPFEASSLPQVIFPAVIVILMIGCAGFYLATNYIFKRKLNLD
jgi:hypothetical protein